MAAGLTIGFLATSAVYGENIFTSIKESIFVFVESFENNDEDNFFQALYELIVKVKSSDQINKTLEEEE